MLNAAEAAMDESAADDAERQRNRARLYQPPRAARGERRAVPVAPGRTGSTREQVRARQAQIAAEDAMFSGGRG